jgi:hypothetical protein
MIHSNSQATMASGVFVEFIGAAGQTLGQALFDEWSGRPLPNVGDLLTCPAARVGGLSREPISGYVLRRRFDVQTDESGEPAVWVYLLVQAEGTAPQRFAPSRIGFSEN